MPTWATGMRTTEARPGSRGFTLLELMVVLVLIGVLTGAAVLGLRTADPVERAGRFAQQLQAQLALLHEQAEQSATARALRIDPAHYRPYAEDGRGGWQVVGVVRGLKAYGRGGRRAIQIGRRGVERRVGFRVGQRPAVGGIAFSIGRIVRQGRDLADRLDVARGFVSRSVLDPRRGGIVGCFFEDEDGAFDRLGEGLAVHAGRGRWNGILDEGLEGVEGVLAVAAAHAALAGAQLFRTNPEGRGARRAAREDHGPVCSGRTPSSRTQPSDRSATRNAM